MSEASDRDPAVVRQKLNHDTAKIKWGALHEHQQIECVIAVSADLDLIDVACEFALDNHDSGEGLDGAGAGHEGERRAGAAVEDRRA